jgi:hypothetical protein
MHFAVLIGTTLNIYRRFEGKFGNDDSLVRHIVPDVSYFSLFYSDNLVVYTTTSASLYSIGHSTLNIDYSKIPTNKFV